MAGSSATPTKPPRKRTAKKGESNGNGSRKPMSDQHKAALRTGRAQSSAVSRYLDALDSHKPKRGRQVKREDLERRLNEIDNEIGKAPPMDRLLLDVERDEIRAKIETMGDQTVDLKALEEEFVMHAKGFSQSRGVTRRHWRKLGVSPEVLARAGI